MMNYLYVLLGLSLGLLVYFLLSPLSAIAAGKAREGLKTEGLKTAGPPTAHGRLARRCPLCGSSLRDGEGVRVKALPDGTMTLLGCPRCVPASGGN